MGGKELVNSVVVSISDVWLAFRLLMPESASEVMLTSPHRSEFSVLPGIMTTSSSQGKGEHFSLVHTETLRCFSHELCVRVN